VSAQISARTPPPRSLHGLRAPAVAGLGLGFLLIRTLMLQGNLPLQPILATGFAVLLVVSLSDRGEPATRVRRMPPGIALIVGCAAASLAAAAAPRGGAVSAGGPVSAAAAALTCLAAISEEAFFRRFLYEQLSRFGTAAAVAGPALLFAAIHIPAYGLPAFPLDLGAGLLFGWQRWASGTWTVSAGTHLVANLEVMFS
jgi:membrane protease YdiL (CAAX protease family)